MALYPAPLDAILGAIAAQNGITLDPSMYTFGTPTPNNDSTGVTNTSLSITVNTPRSPYQGATTVNYRRLSLSDLGVLLPLPIMGNGLSTVQDVVNLLNNNYGLNFAAGDISNVADALSLDSNGAGQVTLTAAAGALYWIGTVSFGVIKGNYDLDGSLAQKTLPGLMYPAIDETKPYGDLYSYWRDFTTSESSLTGITTSTTDLTAVAAALTAITGNTWTTTGTGRYCLAGASVLYNGVTYQADGVTPGYVSPIGGVPNGSYTSLLVIQLGSGSLGYSGLLWMHYGLTDDGFDTDDGGS